jgi:hypothetical protein
MARKVAYIGISGPLGYDYRNGARKPHRLDLSSPNPVLENVSGLLICYDELIFLSRHFCPADMRKLPYVRFISDDKELLSRAQVALEQAKESIPPGSFPAYDWLGNAGTAIDRLVGASNPRYAIDNHTHDIHIGRHIILRANAAIAEYVLADINIAASLDIPRTDVISNTPMLKVLEDIGYSDGNEIPHWKLSAADLLVPVHSVNYWGPRGAYHESLEQLRNHPRIREFREYLSTVERPDSDAEALAKETSELAMRHARDGFDRYLRGRSKSLAIGGASVGIAGDLILPGTGTAAHTALQGWEYLRDYKERRKVAWALFVVDASMMAGAPDA